MKRAHALSSAAVLALAAAVGAAAGGPGTARAAQQEPAAGPRAARSAAPIRVGAGVPPPRKVHDVPPVYPEAARTLRVQGRVILEATIGPTGEVVDVGVLRSVPELDEAAIAAVEQWRYEPTLVDGEAVPVVMTVTMNFSLPVAPPAGEPAQPAENLGSGGAALGSAFFGSVFFARFETQSTVDGSLRLVGGVEFGSEDGGWLLSADEILLDPATSRIVATGNIVFETADFHVAAERIEVRRRTGVGPR